jgi:hypothetical protein
MHKGTLSMPRYTQQSNIEFFEYPTFNPVIRSVQMWRFITSEMESWCYVGRHEYILRAAKEINFLAGYVGHEKYEEDTIITTFQMNEIISTKRVYYTFDDFFI